MIMNIKIVKTFNNLADHWKSVFYIKEMTS